MHSYGYTRKNIIGAAAAAAVGIASLLAAAPAAAQEQRMKAYHKELEGSIEEELNDFREDALRRELEAALARAPGFEPDEKEQARLARLRERFGSVVQVYDSNDGEGQDVEIRLTMPIDLFMEFAPIAALEAAAVKHKFPVVYIFLREETTDRVARVAFRDAEPIAGRYLAGDPDAVEEMKDALIWH